MRNDKDKLTSTRNICVLTKTQSHVGSIVINCYQPIESGHKSISANADENAPHLESDNYNIFETAR